MKPLIAFFILSVPLIVISRRSLLNVNSHGFYRFFAWECILLLIIINIQFWFKDATNLKQIISWFLLASSLYMLASGIIQIKKVGRSKNTREDKELYQFEKTTQLVRSGVFKYIRHPLYSSLLFLAWGAYFKNTTILTLALALLSTVFLFLTAIMEEKECLAYFGKQYIDYMKRSKRFIPFLV